MQSDTQSVYKILLEDIEERKDFFAKKKKEYGIEIKKLTIDETNERLASGFKWLFKIIKGKGTFSSNPLYKFNNNGEVKQIKGTYNDLLNFFKEGGIDPFERTSVFFDKASFTDKWNSFSSVEKLLFYFSTKNIFKKSYPGLDIENIFTHNITNNFLIEKFKTVFVNDIIDYYSSIKSTSPFIDLSESILVNSTDAEEKFTYVNKYGVLYLSPIERFNTAYNYLPFLDGHKNFTSDWNKVKKYLEVFFDEIKDISREYYAISIDTIEYQKMFGDNYTNFLSLIKSLPTKPASFSSFKVHDIDEYIDIIGINNFISKLFVGETHIDINIEYLDKLLSAPFGEVISFHTNATGRRFIGLCEHKKWDIFSYGTPNVLHLDTTTQFMYESGVRLFKESTLNDVCIFTFDIETKALPEFISDHKAALFPERGQIFSIGMSTNWGFNKVLHIENQQQEREAIEQFYQTIGELDPDFILGYNSEAFDFPFIEKRLEMLGGVKEDENGKPSVYEYIRQLLKPYFDKDIPYNKIYSKKQATLKVGGTVETYMQTSIYGISIFDGIHQIKKLQAIDGREYLGLKQNVIHERISKANRVYVKGDKIGFINNDQRDYFFNDKNGDYFVNEIVIETEKDIFSEQNVKRAENGDVFYKNLSKLYINVEGDVDYINTSCVNIITLKSSMTIDDFKTSVYHKIKDYEALVIPEKRFGLATPRKDECITFLMQLKKDFVNLKNVYTHIDFDEYEIVTGKYIVERYLLDDLWETHELFKKTAQSSFMLANWVMAGTQKVFTMGNASMWKIIIACWYYHNKLGIPNFEMSRKINGGLIGMLKSGYCKNVVKYDASSLYPSVKLAYLPAPKWDITNITDNLLDFFLSTRLKYKGLAGKAKKEMDKTAAQFYDVLQLPLKIFINSYYGFLGAWNISPFSDMLSAHGITAISRTVARHMILWFEGKGFEAIYSHTDGINFIFIDEMLSFKYTGTGQNWLVTKDKEYEGLAAYVAMYNDLFMEKKMGIDIDGVDHSCINIAKSNVVHLKVVNKEKAEYKLDVVGGLIKKDTPPYIRDFIEDNIEILMTKDPKVFIDNYIDYVKKIAECKINGISIAKKIRIKSLDEYKNTYKSRIAPYELIIKKGLQVEPGSFFYYYNNGFSEQDFGVKKEDIGYFYIDGFSQTAIEKLTELVKSKQTCADTIERAYEKGYFVFNKQRVDGEFVIKKHMLKNIDSWDNILVSIEKKNTKKQKSTILKVIKVEEILNVTELPLDDHFSTLNYNPEKYLKSFYSAIEPLFLVFNTGLRNDMLLKVDPATKKIAIPKLNTLTDIKLVNGIPLQGKEHNQQSKSELLKMDIIEKSFWYDMQYSPKWFLNKQERKNQAYWVNTDFELCEDEVSSPIVQLNNKAAIHFETFSSLI
jgi:DNA polymerase elongation subunit (family B)